MQFDSLPTIVLSPPLVQFSSIHWINFHSYQIQNHGAHTDIQKVDKELEINRKPSNLQ